jgi:hypothetical protein
MILWTGGEKRRGEGERGFALATVVMLSFFLFALVASYFIIIVVERSALFSSKYDLKAEAIAEAGIEEVMWEYNFDGQTFTGNVTRDITDNNGNVIGNYAVNVTNHNALWQNPPVPPWPVATSVGTYNLPGGGTKVVTLKAQVVPRPPFSGAITAKQVVRFTGNGFTDSYDSNLGPYGGANVGADGDVRTNLKNNNDAIDLNSANGNPVIAGDASTGSGSAVDDPSKVSGASLQAPQKFISDVVVPAALTALGSSGTLSTTPPGTPLAPGSYKYDRINMNGGDVAEVGVNDPGGLVPNNVVYMYITGNVDVGGNAQLRVNPGATLILYVNGAHFDAGGNGVANLSGTQYPMRLQVYCTSNTTAVDIRGGTDFISAIKAPYATIGISGSPAFYGAFVGNSVTASGGGGVHFDVQLRNLFDPEAGADIDWIRRV